MYHPNFCGECGERMSRRGWRAWINPRFCVECARRLGKNGWVKPAAVIALVAVSAFSAGRLLRPPAPPLIIQRAANSTLSDLPVSATDAATRRESKTGPGLIASSVDEPGYICGARTKKGRPCHRRVPVVGERCFQHKGLAAMVSLEKLVVKSK